MKSNLFINFDNMCWAKPGRDLNELSRQLALGIATKQDMVCAASILSAYQQMISDTQKKRNHVVKMIRKHSSKNEAGDIDESGN
jgi:hypothetical protein